LRCIHRGPAAGFAGRAGSGQSHQAEFNLAAFQPKADGLNGDASTLTRKIATL
jgi:hypothetical protein